MSIVEVLIALGMAGMLALVVASMMEQIQKGQKQSNVINTIEALRISLQKNALDSTAWGFTVAGAPLPPGITPNATLACLRNNVNCAANVPLPQDDAAGNPADAVVLSSGYVTIDGLLDGGNNTAFSQAPGAGFTDRGEACTTWTAAGNDNCPIRYDIRLGFICPPGPATCLNPAIELIAILNYTPDPANPNRNLVNPRKYRLRFMRGSGGNFKSEKFNARVTLLNGGTESGECPINSYTPVNNLQIVDNEITPAGSVINGGNFITFPAGTYTCSGTVTCFECGTLTGRIQIDGVTTAVAQSPGVLVPLGGLGQANIPATSFSLNAPAKVLLMQRCSKQPVGMDPLYPASALRNYGFGMALDNYAEVTVASTLNCIKVF